MSLKTLLTKQRHKHKNGYKLRLKKSPLSIEWERSMLICTGHLRMMLSVAIVAKIVNFGYGYTIFGSHKDNANFFRCVLKKDFSLF